MDLDGSRVIVTGGASGIGAATVDALHANGARVGVLDTAGASGGDSHRVVDVGDEASVVDGVAAVVHELGGLDAAVLNAGVGGMSPLLEMTTDEWDRVMRVNLRGVFLTLRQSARVIVEGGNGGAIVIVTSVSGFLADTYMSHYSVSKAGAAQLARVAARELGPRGVRVNAVAPGTTDTPMFSATDRLDGYGERVAQRAALGRLGRPDEVAQAVVALLTLDWVTGQVLAADGGVSLFSPIDPAESFPRRPR